MTCLEQNKVDWSLFQQGVFQNQSTELNLHSNGTVKWLLVEVIWVFLVKFQFILLPYKYFLSTRMQHFINFIAQTFKFIISKGILTTEAKKKTPKNPDHSHPRDFFSEERQTVSWSFLQLFSRSLFWSNISSKLFFSSYKGDKVILVSQHPYIFSHLSVLTTTSLQLAGIFLEWPKSHYFSKFRSLRIGCICTNQTNGTL